MRRTSRIDAKHGKPDDCIFHQLVSKYVGHSFVYYGSPSLGQTKKKERVGVKG
jgi:hypothetical protein